MSSLTVAAVSFGVIALSEPPDTTALASLVLATRYRAAHVFIGVAAAFLAHVCLVLAAISLLRAIRG
ncbi:hypothetical protein DEH69_11145 [Streptomyces sp. PT12]|nr:hypothetical protein DEH69_11145 [Streptomyces sp. PT12]